MRRIKTLAQNHQLVGSHIPTVVFASGGRRATSTRAATARRLCIRRRCTISTRALALVSHDATVGVVVADELGLFASIGGILALAARTGRYGGS